MSELTRAASEGHYAKKQILCKDWLISWSHRRRFEVGLRLARERAAGGRVLDYGCGDGSFLAMLDAGARAPRAAVGAEVSAELVEDCRRRLGGERLGFVLADELDAPAHQRAYDLVVCMEVLEHVVETERVVERLSRLVAAGGTLLVSVPVETGLPLLLKQAARRVAGWRGIGDYPGTSAYTARELWAALWAGPRRQHVARPVHAGADGERFHDHKGFNWMRLRATLAARFRLEATHGSPLTWLPPHLGSQAWFVLRNE